MLRGDVVKLIGFVAYLLILLAIGVVASGRMKSVRDYFAAGKRLGFLSVAFSARATGESAWLLLGLTGMGAAVGVQAFWVVVGELLGVAGAWVLLSRRFKRLTDRYDSITIPDYLESRFRDPGHTLRLVAVVPLVVFVTIYVSAQIDSTGKAFHDFLDWPYKVGALVGFAVVVVYIVGGGFLAVVWSDVFQGTLMVVGLVAMPIVGLAAAGGIGPVIDGLRAQEAHPDAPVQLLTLWPDGPMTLFTTLGLVLIGLGFLGSPQIFVRFLALKSEREIPRGTVVAITWTLLADCGAVCTGLVGRHLFMGPGDEVNAVLGAGGENVLPMMINDYLPVLFVGIGVAVVLAAIMSTIDSLLVVASSAVVRDYYQKTVHPELRDEALVSHSRVATIVLAVIALGVAMTVAALNEDRTIFWFVVFGWSGIAATFCPTIILSLFWRGMTARGAVAAMVAGFVSVPIFKFGAPALPDPVGPAFGQLAELGPAFLVSFVVGIIVSLGDPAGRARLADVGADLEP